MRSDHTKRMAMGFRTRRWVFGLTMAVLGFTGFGQMPVFKRYYISSIPGMGWSAEYYITLGIHYMAAAVLLGFVAYTVADYFFVGKRALRITPAGYVRMVFLACLVVTGVLQVFKNLPDFDFSRGFNMVVDISHLMFMMGYVAAALIFWRMKARWVAG